MIELYFILIKSMFFCQTFYTTKISKLIILILKLIQIKLTLILINEKNPQNRIILRSLNILICEIGRSKFQH